MAQEATLLQLTQKHEEVSSGSRLQYKFFCDKCGDSYYSPRVDMPEKTDENYEEQLKELTEGLVIETRTNFRYCKQCTHWVCFDLCWNAIKCICEDCSNSVHRLTEPANVSKNNYYSSFGIEE